MSLKLRSVTPHRGQCEALTVIFSRPLSRDEVRRLRSVIRTFFDTQSSARLRSMQASQGE